MRICEECGVPNTGACSYCGHAYCEEHRPQDEHDCTSAQHTLKDRSPDVTVNKDPSNESELNDSNQLTLREKLPKPLGKISALLIAAYYLFVQYIYPILAFAIVFGAAWYFSLI